VNMYDSPSIDELKALIALCDDNAGHHILWVSKSGEVNLSTVPDNLGPLGFEQATPDMQIRYVYSSVRSYTHP